MADVYELDPRPVAPALPGTVVVRESVDELVDAIAADLFVHAHNCIRTFGDFHLALSGGSTPLPLYRRLMYDPAYRELPWMRTHAWIVDERRVPFDDPRSNFKMINELIGDHSGIPPEQLHPIFAQADDADIRYEAAIRETLAWREPGQDRLDFVLLGMGGDGHTASIFPHSPALEDGPTETTPARLVMVNSGPAVTPPDRVTMTLRLINASRFIAVMVTGAKKRRALAAMASVARGTGIVRPGGEPAFAPPREIVEEFPILGVRPLGGELRWYLDYDACCDAAALAAPEAP